MAAPRPDLASQALQGVNQRLCAGCDRPFRPTRATQVHCRPGCRVLALRRRRDLPADLFTSVADAIEPAVLE
jgi:hypothetical protein